MAAPVLIVFWGSILINVVLASLVTYLISRFLTQTKELVRLKTHEKRHERAEDVVGEARDESEAVVADFKSQLGRIAGNLEIAAQRVLTEQVEIFKNELSREAKTTSREIAGRMATAFDQVEMELEEYKRARMLQINAEIEKILTPIAKEVLGRAISTTEQEEIVRRMLTKYDGQPTGTSLHH